MVYWTCGSGLVELDIPRKSAMSVLHPGDVEKDVRSLAAKPKIKKQLDNLDPEKVRLTLVDFGCWDSVELQDKEMNLIRLLWIAASDVAEGE